MTHRFPARLLLPVLAVFLAACGEIATPENPIPLPSNTPRTTPTESPAVSLSATDVVGPAITPTIPPSAPMPGLVYTILVEGRGMVGPWIVEQNGQGRQLGNKPDPALSPDRGQLLYSQDGDLWVMDLLTGTEQNLTNTYDIIEESCQWWPARPGLIVFQYRPRGNDQTAKGYLARIQSDGGSYYIIDGQVGGNFPAAPSPDGQSIVYDREGQPWIFTFGAGRTALFPKSFPESFLAAVNPAWSPDSRRIAWQLYGLSGGTGEDSATAVLNLDTMSVTLLHRYPAGSGDAANDDHLAWSPDGKRLAVANRAEQNGNGQASLWVMFPDGSEEIRLGPGDFPVWSPDGSTLVFQSDDGVQAVKVGNWVPFPITLPLTARIIDWVEF